MITVQEFAAICVIGLVVVTPNARGSTSTTTYDDLMLEAKSCANPRTVDGSEELIITCNGNSSKYYFTKQNHRAHPSVVKFYMAGGEMKEDAYTFAPSSAESCFEEWRSGIEEDHKAATLPLEVVPGASLPPSTTSGQLTLRLRRLTGPTACNDR